MQSTCISPLCKIYDFALSDGNRKTQKRMVFLLPFVGRPMDSQNKGRHQRCPSVEPCVRDGSWGGKPVLKPVGNPHQN